MKKNCWEIKNCGRELGGTKAQELGVCPASTDERLNGVHNGENAGRACWVIAGTLCRGEIQGTFAKKREGCTVCDFFRLVKEEEKQNYAMSIVLLNRLGFFNNIPLHEGNQ